MALFVFDTYQFIERLKNAGFEEEKAKALSDELRGIDLQNVASKHDILEAKTSILQFIVGLFVAQVAVFITLAKLL